MPTIRSEEDRVAEIVYLELCGPGDTAPDPAMVKHAERLAYALTAELQSLLEIRKAAARMIEVWADHDLMTSSGSLTAEKAAMDTMIRAYNRVRHP